MGTDRPTRILAIDVGTGTQDILLFESGQEIENCLHLIMPSPTVILSQRVRRATADGRDLLLTGITMGGGPGAWAVEAHIKAGFEVWATPDAARTFDDDLEMVARMGVHIIGDDEVDRVQTGTPSHRPVEQLTMRDLDLNAVFHALHAFDVSTRLDALAVAVFDHGAAPPGYSDRRFRFDYLTNVLSTLTDLTVFAHERTTIPASLTRMAAVATTAPRDIPLVVMDTGAAAVVGGLDDPRVRQSEAALVVNVGNFHTLAFALHNRRPIGLFEHHTGLLTTERLDVLLHELAAGTIENEAVFADSGHGAFSRGPLGTTPACVVTGPRRSLLAASLWKPYFAVPHGDMMLAGCYGLLRGVATALPQFAEPINTALDVTL